MRQKEATNHGLHLPVLLDEVIHYLDPHAGDSYLDLTAGYGGHAQAVLETTGQPAAAVLVDRDEAAAKELRRRFGRADIRQQDFLGASQDLLKSGKQFDLIMADLGVSSPHLNEPGRGFALNQSGPLDMRMDRTQQLTAQDLVNTASESQLIAILRDYGEEPKAKQIAAAIVAARPLQTTDQLAAIAARAWPGHSRVHPATRTFQALRIAVNDELNQLEQSLSLWIQLLRPNGRLVVISFHSLEDRLVKQAFSDAAGERYDAELRLLTKTPITAGPHEIVLNPRARSAKLRAAVKINNQKGDATYADSG
jgi:16S rRNA (cytosine1402-N4)-methyltransferase